jgi:mannose-6-phosphate isomerase-like protein (cupin superfamily)
VYPAVPANDTEVQIGHNRGVVFETARVAPDYDVLAPDGSEIRLLVQVSRGSMVHCTLRPGQVTRAVRHRGVEEAWFCTAGSGDLWRRSFDAEQIVSLQPGTAVSIPPGTEFQFRATADQPLEVVITTMPPWPGEDEAVVVRGCWEPTG